MDERRNDTTQTGTGSPPEREHRPRGSYYYDDDTGYEIYHPEPDEDDTGMTPPADAE
jgi:hypothetical protein